MQERKRFLPLTIFGDMNTVTETKTKFWEITFFVVETKIIILLSGVIFLALGLIKINKSEYMC